MEGLTLKMLRVRLNYSQEEAAQKVNVSVSTWRNWERAKTFPSAEKIRRIEEEFDTKYDQIIFLPKNTV